MMIDDWLMMMIDWLIDDDWLIDWLMMIDWLIDWFLLFVYFKFFLIWICLILIFYEWMN